MDLDISSHSENENHVFDHLEEIVSKEYSSHDLIDDALRTFLNLATSSLGNPISTENDVERCSYLLLSSSLFETHEEYVRRQIVHCLLQDDDPRFLLFVTSLLLLDMRESESTADLLNDEGAFTRLIDLISNPERNEDAVLHRMLMDLLYEMSRIQRIKPDDLVRVDDVFVCQLFKLIEELSSDVDDPYHYPVIRVLLVLNEQFMVSAHDPATSSDSRIRLTNKVIKVLASQGSSFKTFGENIILLLNRESETSLQLLTLKLLYLLFTTPSTQEYFYTNDLRVLVDILVRNLLDLPSDAAALRHTYLRVLYPLLAHTQLKQPPHYKREEIRKLLAVLVGTQSIQECGDDEANRGLSAHFEDADETTKRLVARCRTVTWLGAPEAGQLGLPADVTSMTPISPVEAVSGEKVPPVPPTPRKLRKRNGSHPVTEFLAPQLQSARESALSVHEVAAQREKPGVITPSRKGSSLGAASKKEKPQPPKTRRSAWSRSTKEVGSSGIGPSSTERSSGSTVEQADMLDTCKPSAAVSMPGQSQKHFVAAKKPPPAPKSRRWHGKRRKKEDEGGGVEKESADLEMGVQSKLPGPETASLPASVAEALSAARAEAMDSLSSAIESTRLGPTSPAEVKIVLAPPSPAPPREIPGPIFSLERSPFIGEEEG